MQRGSSKATPARYLAPTSRGSRRVGILAATAQTPCVPTHLARLGSCEDAMLLKEARAASLSRRCAGSRSADAKELRHEFPSTSGRAPRSPTRGKLQRRMGDKACMSHLMPRAKNESRFHSAATSETTIPNPHARRARGPPAHRPGEGRVGGDAWRRLARARKLGWPGGAGGCAAPPLGGAMRQGLAVSLGDASTDRALGFEETNNGKLEAFGARARAVLHGVIPSEPRVSASPPLEARAGTTGAPRGTDGGPPKGRSRPRAHDVRGPHLCSPPAPHRQIAIRVPISSSHRVFSTPRGSAISGSRVASAPFFTMIRKTALCAMLALARAWAGENS